MPSKQPALSPSKGVIQAGHILALVFIALLLAGARGFLGAHPVLSGVLLALVAPVYYLAARISGHRQFLHPAALLATLGFQLVVYGAGAGLQYQALLSLAPIGVMFFIARRGLLTRIEDASQSLYGAINFTIVVFSLWVLLRLSVQFATAAWATFLALAAYALYAWFRFLHTEKVTYLMAMVTLGSVAFLFLLYRTPAIALGMGAVAGLLVMADLFRRRMLPRLETTAFILAGAYLILMALTGSRVTQVPLGYLVLAGAWLHLGLLFHRPELPPLAGPHPASLPRLLPLFGAGILLALAPVAIFYPWEPGTLPVSYLALFFIILLATSRELGKQSFSLIGVVLSRVAGMLARLAPLAALLYLGWRGFPGGYRIALASVALALLSLLAAWRQVPRILRRRNLYAYQAVVFATVAYFAAEQRIGLSGYARMFLDSGVLLLILLIGFAALLATRVAPQPANRDNATPAFLTSLYEAACLPAAVACVLQVMHRQLGFWQTLIVGVLLAGACVLMARTALGYRFSALSRQRAIQSGGGPEPAPGAFYTLSVVLGFWIYVAEWAAGVRGEWLGMPYLAFGFVSAGFGYVLLHRTPPRPAADQRWYQLFYFMWFLCTGVSLALFYPMREVGAYAFPLWAIAFLLVSRGASGRRDLPFAIALESVSALIAAASVIVLCVHGLYFQTGVALLLYAAFYAWVAWRHQVHAYLYPAAISVVAASFFGVLSFGSKQLFFVYFLPLAAVLYLISALLRQRGRAQDAHPLEFAASAAAAVGALLFLTLPFGSHTVLGFFIGAAYVALYSMLTGYSRERVFLTGAGLAGAFALYEFLPLIPQVTRGNRLAFFVPVSLLLVLLGRRQQRAQDPRGGWGLYIAAIAVTMLASIFAMWPQPVDPGASRVVLLIGIAVWPVLLVWTNDEIFIYGATVGLAMLAYHFVQNSTDIFGQHLMAFFLFGAMLVGLVFLAAAVRGHMRFRRPALLVPPKRWYARVVYLAPVALLGVATFGSWGVSGSSNPHFCGTCHNMGAYFANWKKSPHAAANVSCANCHYDPGLTGYFRAKVKGASQLVETLTNTASNRPEAQVNDATCLHSGCHSAGQLARPVLFRSVRFEHATHLGAISRGPQLRCTSCHASVDPATHFSVDTNACFTCHFPGVTTARTAAAAGCVTCHSLPQGKVAFDHTAAGIKAEDEACTSCHDRVVSGAAAVEPRQCRHCHLERASQLMAAPAANIHARHVAGRGIACDWCHGVVKHGPLNLAAMR